MLSEPSSPWSCTSLHLPSQPGRCFGFICRTKNACSSNEAVWPWLTGYDHSYWSQELKAQPVFAARWGAWMELQCRTRPAAWEGDLRRLWAMQPVTQQAGGQGKTKTRGQAEVWRANSQNHPFWSQSGCQQGCGQAGYLRAGTRAKGTDQRGRCAQQLMRSWETEKCPGGCLPPACLLGFGRNGCRFGYFWSTK